MNSNDLDALFATVNLADLIERAMLADALEEAGRDDEAALLRQGGELARFDGIVADIAPARAAYEAAQEQWTGCEWPVVVGDEEMHFDNDEEADALAEAEESPTRRRALRQAAEYMREVAEAAAVAEGAATEAMRHLAAGELNEALEQAERACGVESAYGDCPTWRAFREAIEAVQEAVEDATADE